RPETTGRCRDRDTSCRGWAPRRLPSVVSLGPCLSAKVRANDGRTSRRLEPPAAPAGSAVRSQPLGVLALTEAEGRFQGVVDVLQPDELELLASRFGDFFQVAAVARRHEHGLDPGPGGGGGLLLDATDRQHLAAQADLAG